HGSWKQHAAGICFADRPFAGSEGFSGRRKLTLALDHQTQALQLSSMLSLAMAPKLEALMTGAMLNILHQEKEPACLNVFASVGRGYFRSGDKFRGNHQVHEPGQKLACNSIVRIGLPELYWNSCVLFAASSQIA
ncbi:hypothetical protein ACETIH_17310, partial [Microvirga arabica]